jgi:hypothetical protein
MAEERLNRGEPNAIRMGREVGQSARRFATALGCMTCGIGKAIDVVGRRWGNPPYDWAGSRARDMVSPGTPGPVEHMCKNTTWNLTSKPSRSVGPWEWGFNKSHGAKLVGEVGMRIDDTEKNTRCREIEQQLAAWAEAQGHG